jgi:hypothetical protein
MTLANIRNLQCAIVAAAHQSEEDVEDDSFSGEEMQRVSEAGDGKAPVGTQLRRSARSPNERSHSERVQLIKEALNAINL